MFFALACGLLTSASASIIIEIAALPEGSPATADTVTILSTTDLVADIIDITGIVIPNPAGDGYRLAPRGPGDISFPSRNRACPGSWA